MIIIDKNKCVECGHCQRVCHFSAISLSDKPYENQNNAQNNNSHTHKEWMIGYRSEFLRV